MLTERKCSKCLLLKKAGKEIKGKFICTICLSGKIPYTYYKGKTERSYLKTLMGMK